MTDNERKAVPREATDAMLAAAMRAEKEYGDDSGLPYGSAWRVMFDAAPVLATAPAEPAFIAQTCMCPDPHCPLHGVPVKATLTVSTTAPAEPPERARLNQLASLLDHEASQHVPGEKAAWLYEAANRLREK